MFLSNGNTAEALRVASIDDTSVVIYNKQEDINKY